MDQNHRRGSYSLHQKKTAEKQRILQYGRESHNSRHSYPSPTKNCKNLPPPTQKMAGNVIGFGVSGIDLNPDPRNYSPLLYFGSEGRRGAGSGGRGAQLDSKPPTVTAFFFYWRLTVRRPTKERT
jgi:hypothetical protein